MKLATTIAAGLLALPAWAQTPVLTVYTYDSFVSDWGPGPVIEKNFEENCGCDLQLVGAGDGAALLARVRLEGTRTEADVVLGLDTNLTDAAGETGLFAAYEATPVVDVPNPLGEPGDWDDPYFLPYDWGYFAFVYDTTKGLDVPANFEELAASDLKIVIQDPRSSTPGLGLLMWVKSVYEDRAEEIWSGLSDNIVTVTKVWSEAYGMFLEGEADMVLSYTTSPAYHIVAEGDETKAAAIFEEGHYMQIEVAGKIASTDQPELADRFLEFMLSEGFQGVIPTTNWMYPAVTPGTELPDAFIPPIEADQARLLSPKAAAAVRGEALAEWLSALGR